MGRVRCMSSCKANCAVLVNGCALAALAGGRKPCMSRFGQQAVAVHPGCVHGAWRVGRCWRSVSSMITLV